MNIALVAMVQNARPQNFAPPGAANPNAEPGAAIFSQAGSAQNAVSFPSIFELLVGNRAAQGAHETALPLSGKIGFRTPAQQADNDSPPRSKENRNSQRKNFAADTDSYGAIAKQETLTISPVTQPGGESALLADRLPFTGEAGLGFIAKHEEAAVPAGSPAPLLPGFTGGISRAPALGSPSEVAFALQLTLQSLDNRKGAAANSQLKTMNPRLPTEMAVGTGFGDHRGTVSQEQSSPPPPDCEIPVVASQEREATDPGEQLNRYFQLEPASLSQIPASTSGRIASESAVNASMKNPLADIPDLREASHGLDQRTMMADSRIFGATNPGKLLPRQNAPVSVENPPVGVLGDVTVAAARDHLSDVPLRSIPTDTRKSISPWKSDSGASKTSDQRRPLSLNSESSFSAVNRGSQAKGAELQRAPRATEAGMNRGARTGSPAAADFDDSASASTAQETPTPVGSRTNEKSPSIAASQKIAWPSGSELIAPTIASVASPSLGTPGDSAARSGQDLGSPHARTLALEVNQSPGVHSAAPLHEISLRLAVGTAATTKVDVQLAERAGRVQVAVRTNDQDLTKSLQGNLGDLVGRLEEKGFKTEAWAPQAAQHGGGLLREAAGSSKTPDQSDRSGGQGAQQDSARQQQSDQRRHGRWEAAWEWPEDAIETAA